jgi:hypothetical protein
MNKFRASGINKFRARCIDRSKGCLCDEDASVVELGLEHVLVEGLGVELVAGASLHGISEIPHYHVELLRALLQLSPAASTGTGYIIILSRSSRLFLETTVD